MSRRSRSTRLSYSHSPLDPSPSLAPFFSLSACVSVTRAPVFASLALARFRLPLFAIVSNPHPIASNHTPHTP